MEELNLDAQKIETKCLGHLTSAEHPKLSACMKVWEIEMDTEPKHNPNDFTEYFWLTPAEFHARIATGDKGKGDIPTLIDLFYG